MSEIRITLINEDGESTISGKAHPVPSPLIFPPPIFLLLTEYKTEGKLWDKMEFQVKSGKIEHNGEEYDIPASRGSLIKNDEEMDIRMFPTQPANKPFSLGYRS
ncbi:hypothetical protein ACTFIR_012632 [Dictyostelium discoideum]